MPVNGFENITYDLTPYEKDVLLPKIVGGLATKKGKDHAVTNKHICKAMKERGFTISDSRLRKIINVIRNENLVPGLVATSSGYFVTDDPVELAKYIDSLKQRANEIIRVKDSMVSYLRTLMNKAS